MGSLVLTGDTSGSVTVAVPAVAGANTATFPAATGTVMVSGNMPAFSATNASDQTLTQTTITKVVFGTEQFDTNSNFALNRFTPTVAGYYQINYSLNMEGSGGGSWITLAIGYIYKNGSQYTRKVSSFGGNYSGNQQISEGAVIYFNGSTDYVEIYALGTTAAGGFVVGSNTSNFSGALVRGA
jgi:hypothetical protein